MDIFDYFKDIIDKRNDLIIFELGANNGRTMLDLTEICTKLDKKYTYHMFEPDLRKQKELELRQTMRPNITVNMCAVGQEEGVYPLESS
jgi:SAM-dependent MidA family methyltransferase